MSFRTRCNFLHHNGIVQPDWIEQWSALEQWLDTCTPGWVYTQVGDNYCLEFTQESHLTLYLLRWGN